MREIMPLDMLEFAQVFPIKKRYLIAFSKRKFVTVKIFKSKILINFDVFEVPESEK